jgi:hypothetical protein
MGYTAMKSDSCGDFCVGDIESGVPANVIGAEKIVQEKSPEDDADFYDACSACGDAADNCVPTTDVGLCWTDEQIAQYYGVPLESLRELAMEFLDSPLAELARYLKRQSVGGCVEKARKCLRPYVEFRKREMASWPADPPNIPGVFTNIGKARDGTYLMLFLGCNIDTKFAPQQYVHAVVRSFEAEIPRDQPSHITLLVDSRGHRDIGCVGHKAFAISRHLLAILKALGQYFPERVKKGILYPVGSREMYIFNFFRPYISKQRDRIVTLYHPQGAFAPSPPKELLDHLDLNEVRADFLIYFQGLTEDDENRRCLLANGTKQDHT